MEMVNRYSSAGSFRYGFNGKEKDNEDYGEGNGYEYGFRVYNPRLGRFFSVDPLTKKYPELATFQFSSNSPIANIDLDGLEALAYFNNKYEFYGSNGKLLSAKQYQIRDKSKEISWAANKINYLFTGESKMGTLTVYTNTIYRINSDGKITHEIKKLGELYIPAEGDTKKGGFYFTSERGGGGSSSQGGKMAGTDNNLISIDLLLGAAGFPTDGGEVENTKRFVEIFKKGGKDWGKIIEIVEGMARGTKAAYEAGDKVGEATNKAKEIYKKSSVYYDEDLGRNLERDTDSTGTPTDKQAPDTLHNKKKTTGY